jgi:hypothetical protein
MYHCDESQIPTERGSADAQKRARQKQPKKKNRISVRLLKRIQAILQSALTCKKCFQCQSSVALQLTMLNGFGPLCPQSSEWEHIHVYVE